MDKMTLAERLRNPDWDETGALKRETTERDMKAAADEIERLSTHSNGER
jgi:hypothetical protein